MERKHMEAIIENYTKSWLTKDYDLFESLLHDEVVIKECYGPIYKGKEANLKWFKIWNEG